MRELHRTALKLEAARRVATERVAELRSAFDELVHASENVAVDDEHDPEGHTIAFERQQAFGLLEAARHQVNELEAAIDRVASGTYGTCQECGRPISTERLSALPETRACIGCAHSGEP